MDQVNHSTAKLVCTTLLWVLLGFVPIFAEDLAGIEVKSTQTRVTAELVAHKVAYETNIQIKNTGVDSVHLFLISPNSLVQSRKIDKSFEDEN